VPGMRTEFREDHEAAILLRALEHGLPCAVILRLLRKRPMPAGKWRRHSR
jgi:hypothetical protein